jgi:hypothetical protein
MNSIWKLYNSFSDETQQKINYFNNFADTFFILLNDIKNILEKQLKFLNNNDTIKENNTKNFIKNTTKVKHIFNNKVYWDFNTLLDKEEELFSSFFEIVKNNDLNNILKLDELLKWYKRIIKYTMSWAALNIFPETPFSDLLSFISYGIAWYKLNEIKKNPLSWSKYSEVD